MLKRSYTYKPVIILKFDYLTTVNETISSGATTRCPPEILIQKSHVNTLAITTFKVVVAVKPINHIKTCSDRMLNWSLEAPVNVLLPRKRYV